MPHAASPARLSSLRIVQLNMGRNSMANGQLSDFCARQNIDLALVQEPYTKHGRMPDFNGLPIRHFLCNGEVRAGNNSTIHGAAIIIFNPAIQVVSRDDLSSVNFAVCSVTVGDSSLNLISAYFKFRTPTAVHTQKLDSILGTLIGDTIIAADVNAHTERWFFPRTDPRGLLVH